MGCFDFLYNFFFYLGEKFSPFNEAQWERLFRPVCKISSGSVLGPVDE